VYWLTLDRITSFNTGPVELLEPIGTIVEKPKGKLIRVESKLCEALRKGVNNGATWQVEQGAHKTKVVKCNWEFGDVCWLTLQDTEDFQEGPIELIEPMATVIEKPAPSSKVIKVESKICERIYLTTGSPAVRWKAKQSAASEIVKCELKNNVYELTLADTTGFDQGPVELIEPVATEVFNLALVQKGWPAPMPCKKVLKSATIYKEQVSSIDYLGTAYGTFSDAPGEWYDPTGNARTITIGGKTDRTVLPTTGSEDLLGASPQKPGGAKEWTDKDGVKHKVGSEINLTGIGGGSVFTIDGVTFGLEVCLDHGESRLDKYYANHAKPPDPEVQINLIPSWGMSIGGGRVRCLKPDGLVFNVDGQMCASMARVNDDKWSCNDMWSRWAHANVAQGAAGLCPECSSSGCTDTTCSEYWKNDIRYDISQDGTSCSGCPGTLSIVESETLTQIGTPIPGTKGADVTDPDITDYYKDKGHIVVYSQKSIPKAKTVS
jgi:hypothetical protein